MKITKEFAPITLVLETEEDKRDLLAFLNAASAHYIEMHATDFVKKQLEKLYLLGKDLK